MIGPHKKSLMDSTTLLKVSIYNSLPKNVIDYKCNKIAIEILTVSLFSLNAFFISWLKKFSVPTKTDTTLQLNLWNLSFDFCFFSVRDFPCKFKHFFISQKLEKSFILLILHRTFDKLSQKNHGKRTVLLLSDKCTF